MRRAAAAVLLALAVPVAGCATTGSGSGGGGPATSSTVPTSSAAGTSSSTAAPAPTGPTVTVDGVVERGVEPGCLVLRAGAKSYLLLQGDGSVSATGVPVAVPVRVSGEVLTGIASYCQQGTPLRVEQVTRR